MERRLGINKAVLDEVQLTKLQGNIESKLATKADGLEVNYWESLLSQLKAHLARPRLRDKHKDNLRKKLEMRKADPAPIDLVRYTYIIM